jgi:acetyl-CoA/propionyl-CoA carboxylase biotin carboxyl carrier protein
MTVPQAFDSLIAKLIITGENRGECLERSRRALAEFEIGGMPTVLPFHRAVVDDPAFTSDPFTVHTGWIETEFRNDLPPYSGEVASANGSGAPERERFTVEVGGKRLEVVLPADLARAGAAGPKAAQRPAPSRRRGGRGGGGGGGPAGGDALVSPMQGTIVKIVAEEGQQVSAGDAVVVLEAMKMEQPLTAHKDGTVTDLAVQVGQTVSSGEIICQLRG